MLAKDIQMAFYYDQTRCTTCGTCLVACKDWRGVMPGPVAYRKLHTRPVEGTFPDTKTFPLVYSCNHCDDPACVKACASGAISKREADGVVLIARAKCAGLNLCVDACPFKAVQRADMDPAMNPKHIQEPVKDATWQVDHPAQKCNACADRLSVGKKPVCVDGCPQRALDFGTVEYIEKMYKDAVKAEAGAIRYFPNDTSPYTPDGTGPNIYIKEKTHLT
jgi:anaerobic dimethyl sulfoxide reductase subunit B (iron-sulfur subunit)